MSCVGVAEVTVEAVPLNKTEFWLAVVLKPVPLIVTVLPTEPVFGVKSIIDTWDEWLRAMERRFPTASYWCVTALLRESTVPTSLPSSSYV